MSGKAAVNPEHQNKIPEAVRKQAEKAEHDFLVKTGQIKEDGTPAEPTPAAVDPAPAEPAPVEPAPAPQPAEPQPAAQNDSALQQRYDVLKGKYDKEIPRLQTLLKDQAGKMRDLEAENNRLKGQIEILEKQGASPDNASSGDPAADILDQFEKEYGPQMASMVVKLIEAKGGKAPADPAPASAADPAPSADDQPGRAEFYEELGMFVRGNWQQINEEARFKQWLHDTKNGSGKSLYDDLREKFYSGDSIAASDIFNRYIDEVAVADNRPEPPVDPSRSGGTPPPPSPDADVVRASEVKEFYARVERGVRNVTRRVPEAEVLAFESKVEKAVREGKYIQDI